MLKLAFATALLCSAATAALAASPADILAANKAAMGGSAWDGKATLKLEYAYSGQGLTGTTCFAGRPEARRVCRLLQYSADFRRERLGWRKGLGEGAIRHRYRPGRRRCDSAGYHGGLSGPEPLVADGSRRRRKSPARARRRTAAQHTTCSPSRRKTESPSKRGSIRRIICSIASIEENGTQTITTTYSDYAPVEGAMIAKKFVVDDGSHNLQTFTLTSAKFSEALPASDYQRPAENLHDFSIAGGAHETTVPFHLWNNHIYTDVRVNGSKPMTFIFDTGGHSILAPATAKALGVEAKGNLSSTGGGDNIATSGEAMVKIPHGGGRHDHRSAGDDARHCSGWHRRRERKGHDRL